MRTQLRAGAIVLAGFATTAAAALAAPAETGSAPPVRAAVPGFAQLAPLAAGSPSGPRRPAATPLARRVRALADVAVRREAARPRFPVRAEFNWGQGGARFGAGRGGRAHEGQDVFARTGAPLVAVSDGVVVEEGDGGGRGNYIAIHDPRADRTYVYLHMDRPARVREGARVRAGERIGEVGCTGSCFGDHLHFEVRTGRGPDGRAIDPLPLLSRWAADSGARATLPPGQH